MKITTSDRKKFRVKNKLKKVAKYNRFRLCVSRSTKNISAQVIEDKNKKTLFSASSVQKDIKSLNENFEELTFQIEDLAKLFDELNLQIQTSFAQNQNKTEMLQLQYLIIYQCLS